MNLKTAEVIARSIIKCIHSDTIKFDIHVVGSIRRKCSVVNDIDLLLVTTRYINNVFDKIYFDETYQYKVNQCGERRCMITIKRPNCNPIKCDIFYATKSELPYALLHFTGSAEYLQRIRYIAKRKGLLLNQYGLFSIGSDRPIKRFESEYDILDYLELSRRFPQERTN
jgi:DNA polymerase (family 10)